MDNCIKLSGTILFDPDNVTNKQERQSEWKKVAMVLLEPNLGRDEKGITEYYAWFIKKRFNMPLHKPLRDAHVTFINDKESETNGKWEEVKKKWNGKKVEVVLNVDPFLGIKNRMGDYHTWWLTVPYENREELHSIRRELGLRDRPYFGLHMTIGTAVNFYPRHEAGINATKAMGMFEEHSRYIIESAQKEFLNLGEIPVYQKNIN